MRHLLIAMSILTAPLAAQAQFRVDIGFPSVNIGINMPAYPQLVLVPGSPVYYAPRASSNFFFYDGLYWVYRSDNWYSSSWYNGPWQSVDPDYVPSYVLRVPVRYYRQPPSYFRGWRADAPPRWGQHWGRDWAASRSGWDHWSRQSVPRPAPLPSYQRQYSGERYPRALEQQRAILSENYRHQSRESEMPKFQQDQRNQGNSRGESRQVAPVQSLPLKQQREQQREQPQNQRGEQQRQQQPERGMPQARPQEAPPMSRQQNERHDNGRNNAMPQERGGNQMSSPQERGRENRNNERRNDDRRNDERGQERR